MNRKKSAALLALLLLTAFVLTGCMWNNPFGPGLRVFNPFSFLTSRSYTINESASLSIDGFEYLNLNGHVKEMRLVPGTGNKFEFELKGTIRANFKPKLMVETSGGTVTVRTHESTLKSANIVRNELILTVTVPESFNGHIDGTTISGKISASDLALTSLHLSTVSGAITGGNIKGDTLKWSTVSGGIESLSLEANRLDFSTVSGKISLTDAFTDHVELKTVSGGIEIAGDMERVTAKTTSGRIQVRLQDLKGNLHLSSVSGSVLLDIRGQADYSLHFTTVTGGFDGEDRLTIERIRNNNITATKGAGTYTVRVNTTSGKLTIN